MQYITMMVWLTAWICMSSLNAPAWVFPLRRPPASVSMAMSNSLSRHVDGHLWLKLIPLLCRQPHIQSARQTDFTPRTAIKWRGTADVSLCLSFLSSFTPNCNLISHTQTRIKPPPAEQGNDLVTWWDWDDLELLISVFSEARQQHRDKQQYVDWHCCVFWLTGQVSPFHNSIQGISLGHLDTVHWGHQVHNNREIIQSLYVRISLQSFLLILLPLVWISWADAMKLLIWMCCVTNVLWWSLWIKDIKGKSANMCYTSVLQIQICSNYHNKVRARAFNAKKKRKHSKR